jgi:radical SAM protein with 4Fe4S-binding SPASM domain
MFKRIHIEITNVCNLQCTFCPEVGRAKNWMSPETFSRVLKEALPLTEQICLHLMGEPLAHPEFSQIISECEEQGAQVNLTTNGLLLPRYRNKELLSPAIRQINFSLQSYRDNFPHKPLEDYLLPILDFSKELHKVRPETYVNLRLWNLGSDDLDTNEQVYSLVEGFYGAALNRNVDVSHRKSKRIWERVYLHFDSRFEWPGPNSPIRGERGTCHALSNHIGIHSEGTVVPCCLDKEATMPLGNVLEQPLTTILAAPRARAIRQGFDRGILVERMCQGCDFIKRFDKQAQHKTNSSL